MSVDQQHFAGPNHPASNDLCDENGQCAWDTDDADQHRLKRWQNNPDRRIDPFR